MKEKGRLHSLDYLRGFAAIGIMIYHYISWNFTHLTPDTFMGRVGVYGVSIFYVLSGLTLYHVYYDKMTPTFNEIKYFFKKRIFRIFPLLWLVTIITIILSRKIPNFLDVFLNLTGLFGFFRWDKYFATGAWSIGNELVFYCFFPIFIVLLKKAKVWMFIFSIILFLVYIYFAFIVLDPNLALEKQWKNYINPLNQVFVFLGGVLMGYFFHSANFNKWIVAVVLTVGLCLFTFYPIEGSSINLVINCNRVVLTISCFMICLSFYKFSSKLPNLIHYPLKKLGEISYSLYLIHPIVFTIVIIFLKLINRNISPYVIVILSSVITIICSYYVYQYFEKYFMKLANRK